MSHFTVTICLADDDGRLARAVHAASQGFSLRKLIEAHLGQVLAPFSENRKTAPYRDYEEGGPESYWAVETLRKKHGLNPDDTTLTWAQVAESRNRAWPGEDDGPLLISADGRAYTMSTRNPQAKWDWWVIGGRWPGRFPYRKGHGKETLVPEPHWGAPDKPVPPMRCDGGPVRALDLDAARDEAAARARKRFLEYRAVTAGTPEALPWRVFADNISEGSGYTAESAREEYDSQPRIKILHDSRDWAFCDNEDFQVPEALYTERARAGAVPGYATLTADGRWMAPGEMDWFGMSTDSVNDRIGYWEAANAYIGSLPGDAWLVSADCHI